MSELEPVATMSVRGDALLIRQFEVWVVAGPDKGRRVASQNDVLSIGTGAGNELQLTDPSVSRHHCSLRICERGLELRDLGSTNGTVLGEAEVRHAYLKSGARIRLGTTTVALQILDRQLEQPLGGERLGELLGGSRAMRRLYPVIERCAQSAATVLIQGETGTGKELVAQTIHELGPRRDGPFIVVDCGALPRELIESELFGHVRGAFTGAERDRIGAFESAHGGTLFLDEIGELPLALQPVLLRALESRVIRPIGAGAPRAVDVRVIAATRRDLRVEVNQRRFRSDLYYRLDVLHLEVPPLRERASDITQLACAFWHALRPDTDPPPELVAEFVQQTWPGNVRELRNAIERSVALGYAPAGAAQSYSDARAQVLHDWEREWLRELCAAHGGNIARAARAARMGRTHLRELMARHGLRRSDDDE
ncbi:MAG TPA: sigma 54-interacting transcriptional regulator [Kofleriaceae bacterium]|nr:sigma 54-interacting transcriptional regulator [Kofleriaceae bacterium]